MHVPRCPTSLKRERQDVVNRRCQIQTFAHVSPPKHSHHVQDPIATGDSNGRLTLEHVHTKAFAEITVLQRFG